MISGLRLRNPPITRATLLLALAGGGALILWVGHGTTFREDEWGFVTARLGGHADAYLQPHNEHLLLLPVAVFKALFPVAGLSHYWAYRLALVVVHLIGVALLFTLVERRRGTLVAAIATIPILLLGSASEVLLFPINLGFAGSIAAGLGTLLALDAHSRRGDVVAALLLVVAVASSGLGLSIALGVLVELIWKPDRWRRIWIAAVPLSLYGLWYLSYNLHPARGGPLAYGDAPWFALRLAGAAVAAMLGIPRFELAGTSVGAWPLRIGITLTLVGTAALVWLLVARRVLTPRLAGLIVALGSYWALLGVARAYTNNAGAPRYVYPAAILMLLIAVEATSSMAIARAVLASLAVVALGATALNVHWLGWNGDLYRSQSRLTAAELGALEVERANIAGDFRPITRPGYPFDAAGYFKATDQLEGTVATAPGRLAGLPARDRAAADMVMIRGAVRRAAYTPQLRTLRRLSGDEPAQRRCVEARDELTIVVPPQAGLVVRPEGTPVGVGLRRFASDFAPLPPVADGPQLLLAPLGRSSVPWVAQLTGRVRFRVC